MIYEYAAFFRNYALAVVLTFLAIAWMTDKTPQRRTLAILPLLVLPFTQIYGLLLSMALFTSMVALNDHTPRRSGVRMWMLGAFYAIALVLAIVDIKPPADGNFYGAWGLSGDRVLNAMGIPAQVFLPLPPLRMDHWNKWLPDELLSGFGSGAAAWTKALIAMLLMTAATWTLRRSRPGLVLFLGTSALVLAFCALRFHGNMRHHGTILIAFIGAHWLARMAGDPNTMAARDIHGRWQRMGVRLVLLTHVWAGLFAAGVDVVHPFSNATKVAQHLRGMGSGDHIIIAHAEHCGISVAGALDRPILYPSLGREGTYIPWDDKRRWGIPFEEYLGLLARPDALLLTSDTLPALLERQHHLRNVFHGAPAIQRDETFALYRLE
jgi:hypothetical protein